MIYAISTEYCGFQIHYKEETNEWWYIKKAKYQTYSSLALCKQSIDTWVKEHRNEPHSKENFIIADIHGNPIHVGDVFTFDIRLPQTTMESKMKGTFKWDDDHLRYIIELVERTGISNTPYNPYEIKNLELIPTTENQV